jgi:hypothetical protein
MNLSALGSAPTPLACDNLIGVIIRPHHNGLNHAMPLQAQRELFQRILSKIPTRLRWIWFYIGNSNRCDAGGKGTGAVIGA